MLGASKNLKKLSLLTPSRPRFRLCCAKNTALSIDKLRGQTYAIATGKTPDIIRGINLFLHGNPLPLSDATGNAVEPFIQDGTLTCPCGVLPRYWARQWLGTVDCHTPTEDRYEIDFLFSSGLLHSYIDLETGKRIYDQHYVERESLLTLFKAFRETNVMAWNSQEWNWQNPSTKDNGEYRIHMKYCNEVPLAGEEDVYPPYSFYDYKLDIGGDASYPVQ